ncbi:bifunctional 2-C-methyl-D-erythritol 4-phosphate cytidylyltransferase/2-C-methyl-D-erythritol 2,4-cyclodiphosphate synthase [Salinarimonas soli]|uniref:Bifunctional enzyme IspD/IspF n=1 Tax=Salinarimonas soli TaxID=1638099 RepID=A0A5B2VIJ2_9HYPH|nr:bifunctional 2-C-methyl-D-erythritol 4-phosphate cytidylyltransferase/2-C-methyl-D-erythritol 2,4-cyclodiphosphate synthase [Salinarimonas soli]KAA2238366.1 bifunctional 2-C-methyl-D-erythritol 4-phosphate cytidylyltransferase/2-C-methyl-D-erythritol 2,4-cyclodiphosphate synthase [Salinarimonas soli]
MQMCAVIVAAGRGQRAGGGVAKQYRPLDGRMILARTLDSFLEHPAIDHVVTVIHPDDLSLYEEAAAGCDAAKLHPPVMGAETRQGSVRAGVEAAAALGAGFVLVHDAARPFVSPALIARAAQAARQHGAAIPGVPVTDTIVPLADGRVAGALPRSGLRAVQTPQAFRTDLLASCHARAAAEGLPDFTDDGGLVRHYGHDVHVFEGEATNMKITEPGDIEAAERRLNPGRTLMTRVGSGFDVHAFGEGDHLWLGGVRVPFGRGLIGHSDADVALHALTDAILGALADGDIGTHFPPSDPQWKGASSDRFLAFAAERAWARGAEIGFLDLTIICEAPKVGPLREPIRARIAAICAVPVDRVSVKATTTERLGFTGRGEGIAAMASATLMVPG